jgi:hypothetical protein
MRLWSLHPSYLDRQGLLACWREGLLARKVLLGQTLGYRNHPQLLRFKAQPQPVESLDAYLVGVLLEALRRGYVFDNSKIAPPPERISLPVSSGQLDFELGHLKAKLLQRDPPRYQAVANLLQPLANPVFDVHPGPPEVWERRLPPRDPEDVLLEKFSG